MLHRNLGLKRCHATRGVAATVAGVALHCATKVTNRNRSQFARFGALPREARDLISKIRSCTVRSDLKNKQKTAENALFLRSDLTVQDRILEIRSLASPEHLGSQKMPKAQHRRSWNKIAQIVGPPEIRGH